jgi:hypothetical protein
MVGHNSDDDDDDDKNIMGHRNQRDSPQPVVHTHATINRRILETLIWRVH